MEMQACNDVTLPISVIFSGIFGVINPDSQLPNQAKHTKTRVKFHKIACKTSKNRLRLEAEGWLRGMECGWKGRTI